MNDTQPSFIAWFQSPVFVNVLVSFVMQIIVLTPLAQAVTTKDVASIVDLSLQLAALVFAYVAMHKRKKSKIQPLTLTRERAELASAEASLPTIPTVQPQPMTRTPQDWRT